MLLSLTRAHLSDVLTNLKMNRQCRILELRLEQRLPFCSQALCQLNDQPDPLSGFKYDLQHLICILMVSHSMLFSEILALCTEIYTKQLRSKKKISFFFLSMPLSNIISL
jgi:hypothetical protein